MIVEEYSSCSRSYSEFLFPLTATLYRGARYYELTGRRLDPELLPQNGLLQSKIDAEFKAIVQTQTVGQFELSPQGSPFLTYFTEELQKIKEAQVEFHILPAIHVISRSWILLIG